MRRRAGQGSSPRLLRCCAGVFLVAVPVEVDGRHAATLLAGPVRWRKPARRDWSRAARVLAEWGLNRPTSRARRACLRAPVVGGARYNGVVRLLRIFAQQLSQYAGCCRSNDPQLPPSVAKAMEFVQQRATKPVTMREAARHVHLSPHYFCRLFKKTTGMTFSECVARTRVEKAKTLLRNPFMRISEAAFEAGFGSIPHFNALFRRYTGKSPTEFRRSLRKGAASSRKARTEVGQSPV
jgi:AraC-like DNA-binding protein